MLDYFKTFDMIVYYQNYPLLEYMADLISGWRVISPIKGNINIGEIHCQGSYLLRTQSELQTITWGVLEGLVLRLVLFIL